MDRLLLSASLRLYSNKTDKTLDRGPDGSSLLERDPSVFSFPIEPAEDLSVTPHSLACREFRIRAKAKLLL